MNVKSLKAVHYAVTIVTTPRWITCLSAQNLKGREQKSQLEENEVVEDQLPVQNVPQTEESTSFIKGKCMKFLLNLPKLKLMYA